ncbi:hypothetical protein ACGFJT_21520, partial [Actinomadura geliboluensis]
MLLGLSRLSEDGEITHAAVLLPLLTGAALLAAFIGWVARSGERRPIVVRLLRLRSLGSASATLFIVGAAMYAGVFLLPLYYQQLRDEIVLQAGLLLTPQGGQRTRRPLHDRCRGRAFRRTRGDDRRSLRPSAVTTNVYRVWSGGLGSGASPALLAFAADAG